MANITNNIDVDYVVADYSSVVDALINFANIQYGANTSSNRLWTNFNASSFSRTWLEILAYVSDTLYFYLDQKATENYLQTARVRSSVELIAKQFGFSLASATSSSGTATFTVNAAGSIPRGFKVQASNGSQFYTINSTTVLAAGTVNIPVLQGIIVSETFAAQGLQSEEISLRGPNVIKDLKNLNPADVSPIVTVNGNTYTLVSSLIRNSGVDSPAVLDSLGNVIGGGGRVYTLSVKSDGTPYLQFGDGIFGRKLQPGETVTITYRTGGGSAGNIPAQTLTTLLDSNPIITSVTNLAAFSGGADEQSLDQLRELIPASLRTLDRAVAVQDYSDIIKANFTEVFTASSEVNLIDAGVDLNVYVVPQGLGIPKISENPTLKTSISNFLDRRKTVTVQFQLADAYDIKTVVGLEIFVNQTASRSVVLTALKQALLNFFSLTTGGADKSGVGFGERILLKDIDNVIESVQGIERFEIKKLSYKPRIKQNVQGLVTSYAYSDVNIFPVITDSEWILVAAGPVTRASGSTLFSNTSLTGFTYNSPTGVITYTFPVNLSGVSPGDLFRDGALVDFTILGVDTVNSKLTISTGMTVNNTVTLASHGSVLSGGTTYDSFKCYKKILGTATNLSIDTVTDNNLDLSILKSTATALSARVLLDNSKVFVKNQYSTGAYYLVDYAGHIWEIVSNDSNTIQTSITAVDDASIAAVASGDYKIVTKLTGSQVLFQSSIFTIQYNSHNTIFSLGAQFSQIGTIGDAFSIAILQSTKGNLGVPLDLVSYNSGTGVVRLNGSPQLAGVNTDYVLIDSAGQIFNVVGVDNQPKPSIFYDAANLSASTVIKGSGLGSQIAQGFKVSATDVYAIVSANLKKQGNILGNLTAKIVNDDGTGLPNLASVVAISNPVAVTTLNEVAFTKTIFGFSTPPSLSSGTQYHLVLSPDVSYVGSEDTGTVAFNNSGLVGFTYNSVTGVVQYASAVNLSNVAPGNYFKDRAGLLFKIQAVDDANNTVTLAIGLSVTDGVPASADQGSVLVYNNVLIGIDNTTPSYSNGELARFDGSLWSNSTLGPTPSGTPEDAIFSVEGTKSVTIKSNLTPVMGPLASVSVRYYDDNKELSLVLGISYGSPTGATDANALGKGTVASVANRPVDNFVFRSSRYADDIVNIRANEIPQLDETDIDITIFGGVQ